MNKKFQNPIGKSYKEAKLTPLYITKNLHIKS